MKFANINLDKIKRKQTTEQMMTTKKSKIITRKKDSTENYDILQDLQPLFPAESNETETTISMSALIDKIGSKFKFKFVNNNASTKTSDNKAPTQKQPNVGKKISTKKKAKTQHHTTSLGREADDSITEPRICNIKATRQHILDIRKEMPIKDFEEYVTNVSCQKYESVPKAIFIGKTRYNDNKNMRKWCWIRDRRSLFRSKSKPKGTAKRISRVISSEFEVFYRGEHGIYKQNMRSKRCAGSRDSLNELRNLPRFYDSENEIYALAGDKVNISCFDDSKQTINDRPPVKYAWKAERDCMLDYNNVVVDGDVINIVGVQAKNNGYYICKSSGIMKRDVKLAVLTLPNLVLLSTLLYRKETECTHDDLKRLELLGPEISKEVFQRQSYVKIDSPVCLEDKTDGKIKIRALASVDCRRPAVDCSVSCRRDLQTVFASMCAENVPALATIGVMLLRDGVNYTWRPSKYHKRSVITRSLRGRIVRHNVYFTIK
ncbi:uncharacterized protein LOC119189712 isoform X1 [Manduca sexta]|uniref:uncharacterized protein LOC119189712 isoform X1 n=1 Tax=Manduca sexta TaxID=7130 RepID=UPI00188E837F|nr:uncharacterized protein LOC119189712 isoform X1 [Manduca sexta]